MVQVQKSSAQARNGTDILLSILSSFGGTQHSDGLLDLVVPGEFKYHQYQSWQKDTLGQLETERKLELPQNVIDDNENDDEKIGSYLLNHPNVKSPLFSFLWGDALEDINSRWCLKYRKFVGKRLLDEEDEKFHEAISSLGNKNTHLVTKDFILGKAMTTLLSRHQQQIFLEQGFGKFSQKLLIGYILLITNFVYDHETLLMMKNLLRDGIQQPHESVKPLFSEWTTCFFSTYNPFRSQNGWSQLDVAVIEECFIGPQSLITKRLVDFLNFKLPKKQQKKNAFKAMVGYLVGKQWLDILRLTGLHVKSTSYFQEVFPNLHTQLASALPQNSNEAAASTKFQSNLMKFAEKLAILICDLGVFELIKDPIDIKRSLADNEKWNQPDMSVLLFKFAVESNPGFNLDMIQYSPWSLSQIAQLLLFGKVFTKANDFGELVGDDSQEKSLKVCLFDITKYIMIFSGELARKCS